MDLFEILDVRLEKLVGLACVFFFDKYEDLCMAGYDFKSLRRTYDTHAGRSYDDAKVKHVDAKGLVPKSLTTKCKSPLVIACDVTGSMKDWPKVIFEKLPYLDLEIKEYLDDPEVSFAAIGDVFSDDYPLQVQKFSIGTDLVDRLKGLVIEGNGGGQTNESYDMGALYYARNVKMPNAVQPIMIFIGDEGLYDSVDRDKAAEWTYNTLESRLSTKDAIDELKKKYSVYAVRKLYDSSGDSMSPTDRRIQKQWESYLGADHVVILPEPRRIVDVIFGILAKETGKEDYFTKELTGRQTVAQVKTVMKALKTVHEPKMLADPGKSVMHTGGKGKKTKSLLGGD